MVAICATQHCKGGTTLANRVWKHHQRNLVIGTFTEFDIGEGHVVPSERGASVMQMPSEVRRKCCEQMLMSTEAFLCAHLHWEKCLRSLKFRAAASEILEMFCHVVIGRARVRLAVPGDVFAAQEEPLCEDCPSAEAVTCMHVRQLQMHAGDDVVKSSSEVLGLLRLCFEVRGKCKRMGTCAAVFMRALAGAADEEVLGELRGSDDACALKIARGTKRARTLDPGVAAGLMQKVKEERFRSVSAASKGLCMGIGSTSPLDMQRAMATEYFWSTASWGVPTLQWSIAMDASRLGGEDTSILAGWWPVHVKAAWLLPQV